MHHHCKIHLLMITTLDFHTSFAVCPLLYYFVLFCFSTSGNIDIGEEECSVMMKYFAAQHQHGDSCENDSPNNKTQNTSPSNFCESVPGIVSTLTLERLTQITALYCGPRYTLTCLKKNTLCLWSNELRDIYVDLLKAVELESREE